MGHGDAAMPLLLLFFHLPCRHSAVLGLVLGPRAETSANSQSSLCLLSLVPLFKES